MTAVPLASATVRPFFPLAALAAELGLPRDRFGPHTTAFARTRDGRHLVGVAGPCLAVLHAASGEVAWWVPLPPGAVATPPIALLDDDNTAALMLGTALVGVPLGMGAPVFRLTDLPAPVTALVPCPDDPRSLYVAGPRGSVLLLDPRTGDVRWDLRASDPDWGEGSARSIDVSVDGRHLLVLHGRVCDVWDTHARRRIRRFPRRDEIVAAAFCPDGRVVFVDREDHLLRVDPGTGETLVERRLSQGLPASPPLRVSPDGRRVVYARNHYTLHEAGLDVFDDRRTAHRGEALCDVLPDGDGWVSLWRHGVLVREGSPAAEGGVFLGRARAVGEADGRVTVQRDSSVDVVRLAAREVAAAVADARVWAISPDGRFAVLHDRCVELASGASSPCEAGERAAVDGRGRVVSASRGRVTFWPEGKAVPTPALGPVLALHLSPDGERAFVLHSRLRLLLVDRDGAVAAVKLPAPGPLVALDEARLAIWDHRAALTVYDAAADSVEVKAKPPKRGQGVALNSLAAHPASGLLVGGGHLGEAVLVELATGAERLRWAVGAGSVVAGFSADGSRVVTTADDPFVRAWDVAKLLAMPGPAAKPKARRAKG